MRMLSGVHVLIYAQGNFSIYPQHGKVYKWEQKNRCKFEKRRQELWAKSMRQENTYKEVRSNATTA